MKLWKSKKTTSQFYSAMKDVYGLSAEKSNQALKEWNEGNGSSHVANLIAWGIASNIVKKQLDIEPEAINWEYIKFIMYKSGKFPITAWVKMVYLIAKFVLTMPINLFPQKEKKTTLSF
jgi:6-phosphogluconate dehydrogenase